MSLQEIQPCLPELTAMPHVHSAPIAKPGQFWRHWVAANALGELFGLGLVALVALALVFWVGEPASTAGVLAVAGLMVLLGLGEGLIVGYAQWRVLHQQLSQLRRRAWIGATVLGAFIAWLLGMLPSTIINLTVTSPHGPPPVISDVVQLALAAVLGAVSGVILAVPQWLALRHLVRQAGWWILANALAWLVGMPLIFAGVGALSTMPGKTTAIFLGVLTLTGTGAVVGAIHGLFLVRLLNAQNKPSAPL